MLRKRAIVLLSIASILITSCSSTVSSESQIDTDKTEINNDETSIEEKEVDSEDVEEDESEEVAEVNNNNNNMHKELNSNIQKSAFILDKLYNTKNENVLFSPMSLNMALGMVANGATGETKQLLIDYLGRDDYNELAKVLISKYVKDDQPENPFEESETKLFNFFLEHGNDEETSKVYASMVINNIQGKGVDNFEELANSLNKFVSDLKEKDLDEYSSIINNIYDTLYIINTDNSIFDIANSVWVNDKYKIKDSFKDKVQTYYRAEVNNIDVSDSTKSASDINNWVDEKTRHLIPSIVSEDSISNATASVLVNTIYFNSNWIEDWYETEGSFTSFDGTTTENKLIRNTVTAYYENDKATAFGMRYKNSFEFIGILPNEEGEFNISDLDINSLLENEKTSEYDYIYAEMPRLKYETSNEILKDTFTNDFGMERLFSDTEAEFDELIELNDEQRVYISDIIQKCTIDLDEYGTEAAAVTAMLMDMNSAIPFEQDLKEVEVILNRPFAYLIIDRESNEIAFMGKVVNVESSVITKIL